MANISHVASRSTATTTGAEGEQTENLDFIRAIVMQDMRDRTYDCRVITRFPPEPNGFLHIGHAKSICLNFGVAEDFDGVCNLRFDDTNPETEDMRYVEAIQRDIRWLGFQWGDRVMFASDYYEYLYDFAVRLIQEGKAYVDSLNDEEIRQYRGAVTEPGRESPYRNRSIEENLSLFQRMRAGEFPDGAHVLRAKIDMAASNMKMRDPLLYRIRHAHHYRTGDKWCIYPMYDFAHPLSDALEGVTHSICTLEFENDREIYDWLLDNLVTPPRPQQYEFARLNLDYTVMSKRKLLQLVDEGHVDGWDDPRLLTIAGLRRRGVTPEAIRAFAEAVGVSKTNSRVETALLEHYIRDDLNRAAPRVLCVLRPLKVVLTNYPEDQVEELDASYWPRDIPKHGSRTLPFSRELYIERSDFMENPSKEFYRLAPDREVRLRFAYIVRCTDVIKDPASGEIVEIHCTYDAETKGGAAPKGRKVQGTLHWVSAAHAVPVEVRLYDRLFNMPNPEETEEGKSFLDYINPNSLEIVRDARAEPSLAQTAPGDRFQFERLGYFVADVEDSRPGALVFNRIIELRDSFAKATQSTPTPAAQPKAQPRRPQAGSESSGETESKRSRTEARNALRAAQPELAERFAHYTGDLGLSFDDADVLTGDLALVSFFEDALAVHNNPKTVANWMTNELLREVKDTPISALPFGGKELGALVALVDNGDISATIGKEVFAHILVHGGDPRAIVREQGLQQITDAAAIEPVVRRVFFANADKADQYRSGKTGLLGFFVGQVMKETQGKANPQLVQQLVKTQLESGG